MNKIKRYLAACLLAVGLWACENKTVEPIAMYYQYFPVSIGDETIYNVTAIIYDDFTNTVDTTRYRLKEIVDTTYTNNEGDKTYIIYAFKEKDGSWLPFQTYTATPTRLRAERVENNQRYIKMVFPVVENKSWKGNAKTNLDSWDYKYLNTHKPFSVSGIRFDSTLLIDQALDSNLIQKVRSFEYYAANVGLIYKRNLFIDKSNNKPKGYDNTYRIESYKRRR